MDWSSAKNLNEPGARHHLFAARRSKGSLLGWAWAGPGQPMEKIVKNSPTNCQEVFFLRIRTMQSFWAGRIFIPTQFEFDASGLHVMSLSDVDST